MSACERWAAGGWLTAFWLFMVLIIGREMRRRP